MGNNMTFKYETCENAAQVGDLQELKRMIENGYEWNVSVCFRAAKNGHLHILKYAHSQGLEWVSDTCICAARYGKIDCLIYAINNGCPWDKKAVIKVLSFVKKEKLKIDWDNIDIRNFLFNLADNLTGDIKKKIINKKIEIFLMKQYTIKECKSLPKEVVNFIINEYY